MTSQEASSEVQVKCFYFAEKFHSMFHSQDIQVFVFFNHLMVYQLCEVCISTHDEY